MVNLQTVRPRVGKLQSDALKLVYGVNNDHIVFSGYEMSDRWKELYEALNKFFDVTVFVQNQHGKWSIYKQSASVERSLEGHFEMPTNWFIA